MTPCPRKNRTHIIPRICSLIFILFVSASFAMEVPIDDFSIKPYSQNMADHISPGSADYTTPLLKPEYQKTQLQQFFTHYYSSDAHGLSPWSEQMVTFLLPIVKKMEPEIVDSFNHQNSPTSKRHYAENYKEHDEIWLNKVKQNMDFDAINSSEFKEENRAISVANTFARTLPDAAPDFFHISLPGEGFPFDNLQESAIWVGTPLYVFSVSRDKAWSLVLTPDGYFAWVKSSDIAYASGEFISQWQAAAKNGLMAITETEASVLDSQQHFQFTGYIGAVFPLAERGATSTSILIPLRNEQHQAVISTGVVDTSAVALMPLPASKKNIASILKQLQNRPYGWGGAYFLNDCSQEMKSIFTPFGLWLPRNSAQQGQLTPTLDLSKKGVDERINTLLTKGHPLMTLIYIGGHVMLYVGNTDRNHPDVEAMTYQNIWGLSPANKDKRYVIGQSLFLPLLKEYPEQPDIHSLADKSYFKLVYLDELNVNIESPQAFAKRFTRVALAR